MALTFFCVMMCWVFFQGQPSVNLRGESEAKAAELKEAEQAPLHASLTILGRMFSPHDGLTAPLSNRRLWYTVGLMFVCQMMLVTGAWKRLAERLPPPALGFGYATTLTMALLLAPPTGKVFLYFQF
jgi:hypothetical protein